MIKHCMYYRRNNTRQRLNEDLGQLVPFPQQNKDYHATDKLPMCEDNHDGRNPAHIGLIVIPWRWSDSELLNM
jgi:hypothetical protein